MIVTSNLLKKFSGVGDRLVLAELGIVRLQTRPALCLVRPYFRVRDDPPGDWRMHFER
jgi:hypothetical protein